MAGFEEKAAIRLREIKECPICMSTFTDPRVLPCIHTFCFHCLKQTGEAAQMQPGDKMPCPLCRKQFIIPEDGMTSVQKNFFMESLVDFTTTLKMGCATIMCDICNARNEGKTGAIPTATMRCLECQDNYCDSCAKVHQFLKVSRNHQVVKIGDDTESEVKRFSSVKHCTKHTQKQLDYYCTDCKKIVCVSCFVESHKLHDCKDVATVDEEFRQKIEKHSLNVSRYADEVMLMRKTMEMRRANFLKEIFEKENSILKRNEELKNMIDKQTKSVLEELSVVKSNRLKEIENELEEVDRCWTILRSFEVYCTELRFKKSAGDVCSSVDELIVRADEFERDHKEFIGRPRQSVNISFEAPEIREVLEKSKGSIVVQIKETTTRFENYAVVVGLSDGRTVTKDVIQINMRRPNEISNLQQIPTVMQHEATAAVYCNTMYVAGIGVNADEIWKYNVAFGWMECASLVQGRRKHSAAFIDEVLYICGGFVDSDGRVLDSVEAYNAVIDKCKTVGKLVHSVMSSGNCVPFKSSLYIFGGIGKDDKALKHVQLYDTKLTTCTLLSKPMPGPYCMMRAAVWQTSAILVGYASCLIFNFETEAWEERQQFKTEITPFGFVLENEQLFVFGGGIKETNKDGKGTWKGRGIALNIEIRYIIENKPCQWKILRGSLPQSSLMPTYEKLKFSVP